MSETTTETTNNKKSNKKLIFGGIALVALIAILAAVFAVFGPKTSKGAKAITLNVVDNAGSTTTYDVNTDAEYLGEVFDEVDGLTVEGTQGDYGLYIQKVNGLSADYETDGAYWALYVNDEYGQYSADTQPVTDGDVYGLVYESANATE